MLNTFRLLAVPAMAALALAPATASAHAFLKAASPPVGGTVAAAPAAVTIVFTESVEPSFSTILVENAKGVRVDKNDVHPAGDARQLAVDLTPLPPGLYKVTWHATSTDTHKTEGSFTFTVGP